MTVTIATGFTAMADATCQLTTRMLSDIRSRCTKPHSMPKTPEFILYSWDEVYNAIIWNMQRGSGSEHSIADETMWAEMQGMADWSWSVGGTGLQAACAAARAGHSALASLPAWHRSFQFLLDYPGLKVEIRDRTRTPIHYVLEYQSVTCANRIILRKMWEFERALIAPKFEDALREQPARFHRLLISGYNAGDSREDISAFVQESKQFLQRLPRNRPPVHLELGAILSADDQRMVISELGPWVDSLGMNEDEFAQLTGLPQSLLELDDRDLLAELASFFETVGVGHLIVHTSQFAACISGERASEWEDALYNGVLFAAAKAAEGRYCSKEEIRRWETVLPRHPRGAKLAQKVQGSREIIIVPAFQANAVATVGLGDTFTAGLLVAAPRADGSGDEPRTLLKDDSKP